MATMITSTHLRVDLLHPDLTGIDVRRDIAAPLAGLARFNAHQGTGLGSRRIWSVAQHCVVGAKALLDETGNAGVAFAFLLHDAHEAFIGDITTPTKNAIAELCTGCRPIFEAAVTDLKRRLDLQIHRIAGIVVGDGARRMVHRMDMRMLASEARQILGVDPASDPENWPAECRAAEPVRTNGALSPWPAKRAEDEWMALWTAWHYRRGWGEV